MEVGPALPGEEARWARPGLVAAVGGLAAVAVERGRLFETALEAEGLRRSDELKTALLRGVSHEFRTPLTAIRTAAHAVAEDPSAPGAGELLSAMTLETERLERLVGNLLDLSRLEAGGLTARIDWCAPAEIAAGAVEAADPLLDGRAVRDRRAGRPPAGARRRRAVRAHPRQPAAERRPPRRPADPARGPGRR